MSVLIALIGTTCAPHFTNGTTDRELTALVHSIIVDSLNTGGKNPSELLVAADSTSAAIMHVSEVPIYPPTHLDCPGSTDANGDVQSGVLGYAVKVSITGSGDTRVVSLGKACNFVHRGRGREFYELVHFELIRERGRWRVNRRVLDLIT